MQPSQTQHVLLYYKVANFWQARKLSSGESSPICLGKAALLHTRVFRQLVFYQEKSPILPDDIVLVYQAGLLVVYQKISSTHMPCFEPLVVFLCWYTTYIDLLIMAIHEQYQ